MAKIKIEDLPGYKEGMTAEEKLALLDAYETPEPDYTGYVKKEVLDAKASEAADLSRKLKEKMSAEEQAKAESEAAQTAMKERLESLERDKSISERTAYYLSRKGYDETLAKEAASAFVLGEIEKLNVSEKKAETNYEKQLRAELLEKTPRPDGNGGGGGGKELTPSETIAKQIATNAAETAKSAKSTLDYYTK